MPYITTLFNRALIHCKPLFNGGNKKELLIWVPGINKMGFYKSDRPRLCMGLPYHPSMFNHYILIFAYPASVFTSLTDIFSLVFHCLPLILTLFYI